MQHSNVSPLALVNFPVLAPISGVEMGAIAAGLRYQKRTDLLLMRFRAGTTAAGIFTKNVVKAAPVLWCQRALGVSGGAARALVVNAGNANAFTGNRGHIACERIAAMTADLLGCSADDVMLASTGVIGENLTAGPFAKPLSRIIEGMSTKLYRDAARAIMTTDTFPKAAGRLVSLGSDAVTVNAIAKGSGMIAPNMATLLAFIFTSAAVAPDVLQHCLQKAVTRSFNAITVDGDTSTNDTVLAFAVGTAENCAPITDMNDKRLPALIDGIEAVMKDLAEQIVRDGEGVEHLIRIKVQGAASTEDARAVAMRIGNSPLVKTAIAGNDPNWGRILMAAGNAGVDFDPCSVSVTIGDQLVASGGSVQRSYDESRAKAHIETRYVDIGMDLGMGTDSATVMASDLTHRYIDINADYRS